MVIRFVVCNTSIFKIAFCINLIRISWRKVFFWLTFWYLQELSSSLFFFKAVDSFCYSFQWLLFPEWGWIYMLSMTTCHANTSMLHAAHLVTTRSSILWNHSEHRAIFSSLLRGSLIILLCMFSECQAL